MEKVLVYLPQTVGEAVGPRVQGGKGEGFVVVDDGDLVRPASNPFLKKAPRGFAPASIRRGDRAMPSCEGLFFPWRGSDQVH